MPTAPPNGMPTIFPSLGYRDVRAAIDWLTRVFGFESLAAHPNDAGSIEHAELASGTSVLMVNSRALPAEERPRFNAPYVYVADVRAHYERVKAAGAEITHDYEQKAYGGTGYSCRDLEGNEWSFGSYVPKPARPIFGAIAYLCCKDATAALAFYERAFGAVETGERYSEPDGKIGHAELGFGQATLYVSDEYPEIGVRSPESIGGTASSVVLAVADCDALFNRAVQAGARAERPPKDEPYGRMAVILDPFGHRWMLHQEQHP